MPAHPAIGFSHGLASRAQVQKNLRTTSFVMPMSRRRIIAIT